MTSLGGIIIYKNNDNPYFYKTKIFHNGKWINATPYVYCDITHLNDKTNNSLLDSQSIELAYDASGWKKSCGAKTPMYLFVPQNNTNLVTFNNNTLLTRKE